MAQRLNGVIRALESGKPAFTTFSPPTADAALALHGSKYDGVVFECEHNVWDGMNVRHALQYTLNRAEIVKAGIARSGRDAHRAHSAQWRGNEPDLCQAGPRHGRLRHCLAACFAQSSRPITLYRPAAIRR